MDFDFKNTLALLKNKVTFRQVADLCGVTLSNRHILCPFHKESTPSFLAYEPDTPEGNYFCFGGCGGGNFLTFYAKFKHLSTFEALKQLCTRFDVDMSGKVATNQLLDSVNKMLRPKEVKSTSKVLDQLLASSKAGALFNSLSSTNLNQYMVKKNIPHIGTRSKGNSLVVPVCDENDYIFSLQFIDQEGRKRFLSDGKRTGGMFRLGPAGSKFCYLVEGYATGASVRLATMCTVYVCFSAGNIKYVHDLLKSKYPDMRLVVAGDNDAPGRRHGLEGVYPHVGNDWNDVHTKFGLEIVREQLKPKGVVCTSIE
jgi:phage/plasmid primase-like uncharacterized protein